MKKLTRSYHCFCLSLVACATVAALPAATHVRADQPASLKIVPADAAFYSASTHLREQYDAFTTSRAFAKLREMPIVQMGFALAQAQWNDPESDLAPLKAMLDQPENQQLVELAMDAVSHEVFIYGDESFADLLGLINEINRANQEALRDTDARNDDDDAEQQITAKMTQIIAQHLDQAKVPDSVIGFRLSDTERALVQLARLEQILGTLLDGQPQLKQRLSRKNIAGGDFLVMQLDGSLIPWEAAAENAEVDLSEIRDKVSKMTASVAIGVKDQYLIVSLGDNNDHLTLLGQGDALANRKELAPLTPYAQERICSVNYVSQAFMKQVNSAEQRLDQLAAAAEGFLPMLDLDASLQQEMLSDTRGLAADLKKAIPEPAASTTFVFMSARGYEGYAYNWGENDSLDASQPLTILEHAGGDPILVVAARRTYSPERYDTISKWIGRATYYGETIGVERLGADEREFYQRVRDDLARLLSQLDQITRDKLVPAFRDGQEALVLDAKIASNQWHEMLVPTAEPLPMLEVALVYGVSDAGLLKAAAADFFRVTQEIIDTLHEAEPTTIPDYQLPPPDSRAFPEGTVYYYRLPRAARVDKQVAPNAGLSDDTLVLSLFPKTTVRLLAATPLAANPVIEKHQGGAAAAVQFSFARLIDAVAPWVDYGIVLSGQEVDEATREQIHTGFEIAKCLRGVSAVTYRADGVWVTHFETHLEDLPE